MRRSRLLGWKSEYQASASGGVTELCNPELVNSFLIPPPAPFFLRPLYLESKSSGAGIVSRVCLYSA